MVCVFWFYFVGFIPMCRSTSCICLFSPPLFYVHLCFICSFTLWLASVSFSSLFVSFVPGVTVLAPPVSCRHVFAVLPVFPKLHPVLEARSFSFVFLLDFPLDCLSSALLPAVDLLGIQLLVYKASFSSPLPAGLCFLRLGTF